jgi:hypothetical protein
VVERSDDNEFDLWVDLSPRSGRLGLQHLLNATSQTPFKFIATQYATIAEYRSASGQDAHSRQPIRGS